MFDPANDNLSASQKQLLLDHCRLGHFAMSHVKTLYQNNVEIDIINQVVDCSDLRSGEACLPSPHRGIQTCTAPMCAACQLAKGKRRKSNPATKHVDPNRTMTLKQNDLHPGENVSIDQYESSARGRLPSTFGRESYDRKYGGGTIFVDHATGFTRVYHQTSLSAEETIQSKERFEMELWDHARVKVQRYHADNGIFTSEQFSEHIQSRAQTINFSGVGAHHQNGVAERAVQTVTWSARAMMIHCSLHWPDEFSVDLWPFAMDYACWIYNHLPDRETNLSPLELLLGTKMNCHELRRCRVWGCPAYVLDPRLQDGKKIPKWQPRSRAGQFLGFSGNHSTSIGLIRNLRTDYVSPQFHVVYDEKFTTVPSLPAGDQVENWLDLFVNSRDNYLEGHDPAEDGPIPALAPEWMPELDVEPPAVAAEEEVEVNLSDIESDDRSDKSPEPVFPRQPVDPPEYVEPAPPRRSARIRDLQAENNWVSISRASLALEAIARPSHADTVAFQKVNWTAATSDWSQPLDSFQRRRFDSFFDNGADPSRSDFVEWHPITFQAKIYDADNPSINEVLKLPEPERSQWVKAMYDELDQLLEKDCYETVPRHTVLEQGFEIVKSTWVLRRKRFPDGTLNKLKARFCVCGDLQLSKISD
jgi:hypothetical protein